MSGHASPSADPSPLAVAIAVAREAGTLVEAMRARGIHARDKADASPVTEADEAADALIRARLLAAFPADGWVSEESATAPGESAASAIWIVDPIDGTEAYIDGGVRGYAVQIARVVGGELALGVVYEPRECLMIFAARGHGAFVQIGDGPAQEVAREVARASTADGTYGAPRFIASPRTEPATLQALAAAGLAPAGLFRSVGVKVGMLLRGDAEVYPATHRVAVWDVAAPMLILEEAGGTMTDLAGRRVTLPLAPPFGVRHPLVATRAAAGLHMRVCAMLRALSTSEEAP